ncbi:MAG: hypothetical protein M0P71_00725 [Melioribacteraceae bacterium]|nr:hypothetical protein [Melioribacteraceae bacterium]
MITFTVILTLLTVSIVAMFIISLNTDNFDDLFFMSGMGLSVLLIVFVLVWLSEYNSSTNIIIEAHARIETCSSYKNQNGVCFLNQNMITKDEYEFAVKYNQWLAKAKYWNEKPFCDSFFDDRVIEEKPIRFITGSAKK